MPSRERRILDKDKEIRKLKSSLGHYFNRCIDLGLDNEILKRQLSIAMNKLELIKNHYSQAKQGPWKEFVDIINITLDEIREVRGQKDV